MLTKNDITSIIFASSFILALIAARVIQYQTDLKNQSSFYKEKSYFYESKADSLYNRILEWENNALRIKRQNGIPDSIHWSYKTKLIYPIN